MRTIDADIDSRSSLLETLSTRYDVVSQDFSISRKIFSLLKVRDTNLLIDAIDSESFLEDERFPYWADIWTSSIELARWCLGNPDLNGKKALELGCGLGLSGIAAAHAGALVTFSDYEEDALSFARYNAAINLQPDIFERTNFLQLDWRRIPSIGQFDLMIASDVVYERRNFLPIIDSMQKLLVPGGVAVFTDPGRTMGEYFFELLEEKGFGVSKAFSMIELNGKQSEIIRVMVRLPR